MTRKANTARKEEERKEKRSDPGIVVPLEEKKKDKPRRTAKGKQQQSKPAPKKATKKEVKKETVAKAEAAKKEQPKTVAKCKVYGQPDMHHHKCQVCGDLTECLVLQQQQTPETSRTKSKRGKSFIGFLRGSGKATFATHIAKTPCHMRDIKVAPWNKKKLTWYDTFNELERNVSEDGTPFPLAKREKGIMSINTENLTKEQLEQMRKEVKEFPY